MRNIFYIPNGVNVTKLIAEHIIENSKNNSAWKSANNLILMPNSRSARDVIDYIKEVDTSLLLPNIKAISDICEKDIFSLCTNINNLSFKKAANSKEIIFLLTKLINKWQNQNSENKITDLSSSAKLANELASIIRNFDHQQLDISKINDMDPDNQAKHWQNNYEFLRIISEFLPQILDDKNIITKEQYYNDIIEYIISNWSEHKPDFDIIAVLSTGHISVTRKLLDIISKLPRGKVILPAFDPSITNDEWRLIDNTHPMHHIKYFTDYIGIENIESIKIYDNNIRYSEYKTIKNLMLPKNSTDKWHLNSDNKQIDNIEYIECDDIYQEAKIISMIIRKNLHEDNKKKISLITNNFNLVTNIENILKRWDIVADNSMGIPIGKTAIGSFMLLTLNLMRRNIDPVDLLALLKHPITSCGFSNFECSRLARIIEINLLRTKYDFKLTLDNIEDYFIKNYISDEVINLIKFVRRAYSKINYLLSRKEVLFTDLLKEHIKCVEMLAENNDKTGQEVLWSTPEGNDYSSELVKIIASADSMGEISPHSYKNIYTTIFSSIISRRKYNNTPNLSIITPSEARLIKHDLVIMADFNNDSWPSKYDYSPWLSVDSQKNLELYSPEDNISEHAAVINELLTCKKVFITRSNIINGTPTIAALWLQRMKAVLKDIKLQEISKESCIFKEWSNKLDKPNDYIKISPPSPKPPLRARPKKLSATDIGKLIVDPYSIYAKKILNLKKLDPLDNKLSALDFGNFIHDVFYNYIISNDNSYNNLLEIGERLLSNKINDNNIKLIWWPKFLDISKWFFQQNAKYSDYKIFPEISGEIKYNNIDIYAKADRIEVLDNIINIVDYKTGNPPSAKQVISGIEPQMMVESIICLNNGFKDIKQDNITINKISFWQTKGADDNKEINIPSKTDSKTNLSEELDNFQNKLYELIDLFNNEDSGYLSYPNLNIINIEKRPDYNHLSRIKEWKYN